MSHFNLAVLLGLLQNMSAPPDEGIHLKAEQLQGFMENTLQVIDQQSQALLLQIQEAKRSETNVEEERPEKEEEEEEKEEEDEEDDDDDDDDDEDGEGGDDNNQGGAGSTHDAPENIETDDEGEGI